MTKFIDRRAALTGIGLSVAAWATSGGLARSPSGQFPVTKSAGEWRGQLGAQRYAVLRQGATERAGTSPLHKEHRSGRFYCAGCSQPLFESQAKFESGTGWPSFYRVLPGAVLTRTDRSMLSERTEVLCGRCGGHLGHVFKDGPKPTGLRYCMNGLALQFRAM